MIYNLKVDMFQSLFEEERCLAFFSTIIFFLSNRGIIF